MCTASPIHSQKLIFLFSYGIISNWDSSPSPCHHQHQRCQICCRQWNMNCNLVSGTWIAFSNLVVKSKSPSVFFTRSDTFVTLAPRCVVSIQVLLGLNNEFMLQIPPRGEGQMRFIITWWCRLCFLDFFVRMVHLTLIPI